MHQSVTQSNHDLTYLYSQSYSLELVTQFLGFSVFHNIVTVHMCGHSHT